MANVSEKTDLHTDAYPLINTPAPAGTEEANAKQKKVLGISAAAMLLGGAAWAVTQKIQRQTGDSTIDTGIDLPTAGTSEPANATVQPLPADIDVAGKVTDAMSFDQAFAAAREEVGTGGVFGWHGHWYNTFEKDEWAGLSLEQRQEYTELITGEKLPVKPYQQSASTETEAAPAESEPTIIEGYLNGQRVMGLDFDQDGVIDTLVLDGGDGHVYSVVDATGNNGLDTLYQYDAQGGELTGVMQLEQPVLLSNDDFSQALENSMSQEVVDSILEPEATTPVPETNDTDAETPDETDDVTGNEPTYLADTHESDDDTYTNNGDVRDMDE